MSRKTVAFWAMMPEKTGTKVTAVSDFYSLTSRIQGVNSITFLKSSTCNLSGMSEDSEIPKKQASRKMCCLVMTERS